MIEYTEVIILGKTVLKIKRHYVSMKRLEEGERVERDESDFNAEELEKLHVWQTDRLMEAVGYEREKNTGK